MERFGMRYIGFFKRLKLCESGLRPSRFGMSLATKQFFGLVAATS